MSQDRPPTLEPPPARQTSSEEPSGADFRSTGTDADKLEEELMAGKIRTSSDELQLMGNPSALRKLGYRILMSHHFERIMGAVIGLNFVVVIVETDNNAKKAESAKWVWYASYGLLLTFVTELISKLFVLRCQFWFERWNVFDFFVIVIDSTFSLLELIGVSFVNVSMLRVLRLSRLARATKVFRMFPELKLMLAGLAGAVSAIFWGSVLLFVALLVYSVLAVQFIHPLNEEIVQTANAMGYDVYEGCDRCKRAYESTFQACLTFTTQIVAGDSWGRETQPIIESYPATAIFFIFVYISVGLAVMNLILGVVVTVATEARDRLLREEAQEKLLLENTSLSSLLGMCQEMDDDGNDELTFDEISDGFDRNEAFRNTLLDMDIGRDDLQIVWTILDSDKSGTVTSKEFVSQIFKMKNSDSQFMLAYIKFYITEIKDKLRGDLFKLGAKMEKELTIIDQEIHQEMETIDQSMVDLQDGLGKMGATTGGMEAQVSVNKANIAENTRRIQAEIREPDIDREISASTGQSACEVADKAPRRVKLGRDDDEDSFLNMLGQAVEVRDTPAARPNGVRQSPEPREFSNLMFDSGSLKELLQNVHTTDFTDDHDPYGSKNIGRANDHVELLGRLEHVWQQCIVSIDDMRNFHMSLADLLESMIRRVSITVHHTVSASVTSSTSKVPGIIRSATQLAQAAEPLAMGRPRSARDKYIESQGQSTQGQI